MPCAAVLSVRRDCAPTGAALAEYIEPLMNLLHVWNADCDRMCEDLATSQFSPGGFQLAAGSIDQTEDAWTITVDFTLRGVLSVTDTTNKQTTET